MATKKKTNKEKVILSKDLEGKKENYQVGELITTYVHTSRKYLYGVITEVQERDWVTGKGFKNIYIISIQKDGITEIETVQRYSADIYEAYMLPVLNDELKESKKQIQDNHRWYEI